MHGALSKPETGLFAAQVGDLKKEYTRLETLLERVERNAVKLNDDEAGDQIARLKASLEQLRNRIAEDQAQLQ